MVMWFSWGGAMRCAGVVEEGNWVRSVFVDSINLCLSWRARGLLGSTVGYSGEVVGMLHNVLWSIRRNIGLVCWLWTVDPQRSSS